MVKNVHGICIYVRQLGMAGKHREWAPILHSCGKCGFVGLKQCLKAALRVGKLACDLWFWGLGIKGIGLCPKASRLVLGTCARTSCVPQWQGQMSLLGFYRARAEISTLETGRNAVNEEGSVY